MKRILAALGIIWVVVAAAPLANGAESKGERRLWAAITVNQPIFVEGQTERLNMTFTLVNDGVETINPGIAATHLVVNGKELADSVMIFGNGPRDARFDALPPGQHLLFGYALGEYFNNHGIYRVSWAGNGFKSPELVFRVMPQSDKGILKDAPVAQRIEH